MGRVTIEAQLPGEAGDARELWYDTARWPTFVDGFRSVIRADPAWPESGSLVWESTPHGDGRTRETVVAPDVMRIESERLQATRTVTFEGDEMHVELVYELKQRNPLTPLVDALFIRRAIRDSLYRTVGRYLLELRSDYELLGRGD